jgi:hypothetical protein
MRAFWQAGLMTCCVLHLSACGNVDMSHVSPTVVAATTSAGGAPSGGQANPLGIGPCINPPDATPTTSFATSAVTAITTGATDVKATAPPALANDRVVNSLIVAVSNTALQAHRNVVAAQGNMTAAAVADSAIAANGDPGSLSNADFRTFAQNLSNSTLNPVVADASTSGTSQQIFWRNLVSYYDAYFNGTFVDRFGNTLPKPSITSTISDEEISGVVAVFIELLSDAILPTPGWKDPATGTFYPGASKTRSTYFAVGVTKAGANQESAITPEAQSTQCGITPLKARAMTYLANAASTRASTLGGLVTGGFGGVSIGFGVLGKLSIGDNQTLQTIVKTALSHATARAAEHASYLALYQIGYTSGTPLPDLVSYFLDQSK